MGMQDVPGDLEYCELLAALTSRPCRRQEYIGALWDAVGDYACPALLHRPPGEKLASGKR